MSNRVVVHKGRMNTLIVKLGIDLSAEPESHITSEMRTEPSQAAPLIETWVVEYMTDGSDGILKLTLDATASGQITATGGYMDLKRVIGGQPYSVFDQPLEVLFQGTVTA